MTQRDDDPVRQPEGARPTGGTVDVDCRRFSSLLGDYVDDQLPGETKTAVDGHIAMCAPCMAFLKQYRFAPEAARKLLLKAVPVELEERVLSFLRSKCGASKKDG